MQEVVHKATLGGESRDSNTNAGFNPAKPHIQQPLGARYVA